MIFLLFILSAWGFELNISGVQDIEIQASKHLFGKTAEIPLQKHGDLWVGEVETNKGFFAFSRRRASICCEIYEI